MGHIYVIDLDALPDNAHETLAADAAPERLQRATRYYNARDRLRCLVAGALERHSLLVDFRIGRDYRREQGDWGKPFLPDFPCAHFNISHSGAFVVCATSSSPIGVDVEMVGTRLAGLVDREFAESEIKAVVESAPHLRPLRQTAIWTRKEAFLKYRGWGLAVPLQSFSTVGTQSIASLRVNSPAPTLTSFRDASYRHVLSVCSEDAQHYIHSVSLTDLLTVAPRNLRDDTSVKTWLPLSD